MFQNNVFLILIFGKVLTLLVHLKIRIETCNMNRWFWILNKITKIKYLLIVYYSNTKLIRSDNPSQEEVECDYYD
jgi:hypothetical protein